MPRFEQRRTMCGLFFEIKKNFVEYNGDDEKRLK